MLQCDHETPKSWIHTGPLSWAVLNGATLGSGAGSRIGFAVWYAVPLGALLSGGAVTGALIYGAYGFVRSLSALGLIIAARTTRDFGVVAGFLMASRASAQVASSSYLLFIGLSLLSGSVTVV
jgi:hypothetical protein